jgi:hypothetical protein
MRKPVLRDLAIPFPSVYLLVIPVARHGDFSISMHVVQVRSVALLAFLSSSSRPPGRVPSFGAHLVLHSNDTVP